MHHCKTHKTQMMKLKILEINEHLIKMLLCTQLQLRVSSRLPL